MLGCVSQLSSTDLAWEHFHNPRADANKTYPAALRQILSHQGFLAAKQVIETLPLYAITPMHRLKGLAASLGVAELYDRQSRTITCARRTNVRLSMRDLCSRDYNHRPGRRVGEARSPGGSPSWQL